MKLRGDAHGAKTSFAESKKLKPSVVSVNQSFPRLCQPSSKLACRLLVEHQSQRETPYEVQSWVAKAVAVGMARL